MSLLLEVMLVSVVSGEFENAYQDCQVKQEWLENQHDCLTKKEQVMSP